MPISVAFIRKLEGIPSEFKDVFLALVEEIERSRQETVTRDEFKELRAVVQELAEAQKRTEQRINELAEAQKRTEQRINELAEAQKKTEEEIRKLVGSQRRTREQVGGLSRSVAYALENEAYRCLPHFLKQKHGIQVLERMIRSEIGGEEINLFARARQDGQELILLGEAVLRLDDPAKLRKIKKKVQLLRKDIAQDIVPIIVTHFAKKKILQKAQEAGFLVVQSFEW
jgi:chromosome segregation ATPase